MPAFDGMTFSTILMIFTKLSPPEARFKKQLAETIRKVLAHG